MKSIAHQIENEVMAVLPQIEAVRESTFNHKPAENKWSKKEILGHLIDSAQNNIQRFIRGQYEDTPRIIYSQNDWVELQAYQSWNKEELIQLWVLLNKQIVNILSVMKPDKYQNKCDVSQPEVNIPTLHFLAEDYLKHLKHHLSQIIG